jgi:YfiR/HmsC-like
MRSLHFAPKMKLIRHIVIIAVCTFVYTGMAAQQLDPSNTRVMIQANFLYQFALNNNWPANARTGKFVIAVYGNTDVYQQLKEKYGAKPIGSQVMEIIQVTDLNPDQQYHILFVDKSRKAELPRITKDFKDKSTLVVTNWDGGLQGGSQINFKTIDGNIRYELSQSAMESRKITPGQKILQWKVD